MSVVTLDTGFNIEIEFPIAPFYKRLLAWLTDVTIQGTYLYLGSKLLNGLVSIDWDSQYWIVVLYLLPFIFYHLISEIMMNGQSVGKMVMQLKVMTIQGGQPSLSQYLIRWLFRIIDFPVLLFLSILSGYSEWWVILFLFAGLICVIATPKSQRVGDLIAGTILIDIKKRTSWQDTIFMEVEENYQPAFPEVMQLSDRDINTIRQVIAFAQTNYQNRDYAEKVAAKIQKALQLSVDMDCIDFLEKLLKDYNYLSSK